MDNPFPCPFCGRHPSTMSVTNFGTRYMVLCNNKECPIYNSGRPYATQEQAYEAWNTRAALTRYASLEMAAEQMARAIEGDRRDYFLAEYSAAVGSSNPERFFQAALLAQQWRKELENALHAYRRALKGTK